MKKKVNRTTKPKERIEVTNPFLGICHMQVCAESNMTDKEILEFCNSANPSGTTNGWGKVIREDPEGHDGKSLNPVQCNRDLNRTHFLVSC